MRNLILVFSLFASTVAIGQTASLKSPNVSANALFLYRNSNFHTGDADPAAVDAERNGFDLQEAEIAFYSEVDPYTRLNLLLTVHPEYKADDPSAPTAVEQSWIVEPEELFAESLSLPSVTMKLGKFKAALGKQNQLHEHAFPFVETNLSNSVFLGDEGLNDVGLSAAGLLPASWFSEVTVQFLRGEGENEEFKSPAAGDGVGVVHWKNLFDLNDDTTLEFGLSGAQGGNSLRGTTAVTGADLTLKWRPAEGGKSRSGILAFEALNRRMDQPGVADDEQGAGSAAWIQYQFAERWAALVRAEAVKIENSLDLANRANDTTTKTSAGLVFNASEFSSYRLEYDSVHGPANANGDTDERKIFFQANFTIGAHPAHSY